MPKNTASEQVSLGQRNLEVNVRVRACDTRVASKKEEDAILIFAVGNSDHTVVNTKVTGPPTFASFSKSIYNLILNE